LVRKVSMDEMFAAQKLQCEERVNRQKGECALEVAEANEEFERFQEEMLQRIETFRKDVECRTKLAGEELDRVRCEQMVVLAHTEGEVIRSQEELVAVNQQIETMSRRYPPVME